MIWDIEPFEWLNFLYCTVNKQERHGRTVVISGIDHTAQRMKWHYKNTGPGSKTPRFSCNIFPMRNKSSCVCHGLGRLGLQRKSAELGDQLQIVANIIPPIRRSDEAGVLKALLRASAPLWSALLILVMYDLFSQTGSMAVVHRIDENLPVSFCTKDAFLRQAKI